MILMTIAGVSLAIWGCTAAFNPALLTTAVIATAAALVLFGLWMFFCRDCPSITFLRNFFFAMATVMAVIAALFALIGQLGCAQGAAAVAALFVTVGGELAIGAAILGCP